MKILNFGSLNLDNVYQVPHFLQAGETMAALSEAVHPGGKGLNQSLALARAGAEVYHAGVVGNGSELLTNLLKENGVHDDYLLHRDCTQGSTMIQVSPKGETASCSSGSPTTPSRRRRWKRRLPRLPLAIIWCCRTRCPVCRRWWKRGQSAACMSS